MIKFFQRIRRKLIDEGNLKKYLIYAFGEIILVVVGILIALQVNNWNEERKSNSKANQLSEVLYQELLIVKNYHEKFFNLAVEEEIKNTQFFLTNWKTLSVDSLKKFRQKELKYLRNTATITVMHGFQFFYDPEFPFYKTAMNDGSISIIKNKEFINLLSLIYMQGSARMDFFEQETSKIEQSTNYHICENYATILVDSYDSSNSPRSEQAYDEFFSLMGKDNKLRYLIDQRLGIMKDKKFILQDQIIKNIDKAIELYKE
ncbi:MAG: hypothetical protein IPK25_09565 [Saprospiraceae bacterium]|nr:hypothetical protein [Saprospiraceae bacterium]